MKWTKDKVLTAARSCETRGDFIRQYPGAYAAARVNQWQEAAFAHMKVLRHRWTKAEVLEEARKYTTYREFYLKSPQAYRAAQYKKWTPIIKDILRAKA